MNWYVLQVLTGEERAVHDALSKLGIESAVPIENRFIRSRGSWIQREYVLFPGYAFIHLDFIEDTYHLLTDLPGVIRILGSNPGQPTPISEEESNWICFLGTVFEPSTVELLGNSMYRVTAGALTRMRDRIVKIDPHRRRAFVKVMFAGEAREVPFSIRIQHRITDRHYQKAFKTQ